MALNARSKRGKEDIDRLAERRGQSEAKRPKGPLLWVHAASVGEAQSALILINRILHDHEELQILLTTGTVTSAKLMLDRLPPRAFHQYYPLDNPDWVKRFLNYWAPDGILWMESELWPNMLIEIKARNIPAALINARLSPKSQRTWSRFKRSIGRVLSAFDLILAQSADETRAYEALGGRNVHNTDNLKFSARPLSVDEADLKALNTKLINRPTWVFASTHKGEETLAARVHERLKNRFPELLTMIVPRHPKRRDEIAAELRRFDLNIQFRGEGKLLPESTCDVYIADTIGELGLFYRAAPVACIGRSFSDDGGGGHNPIEAAQLHCAPLYGPNVQNLQDIYDEMEERHAATRVRDEHHLEQELEILLDSFKIREERITAATAFAREKSQVIETVMSHLDPFLLNAFMARNDKGTKTETGEEAA